MNLYLDMIAPKVFRLELHPYSKHIINIYEVDSFSDDSIEDLNHLNDEITNSNNNLNNSNIETSYNAKDILYNSMWKSNSKINSSTYLNNDVNDLTQDGMMENNENDSNSSTTGLQNSPKSIYEDPVNQNNDVSIKISNLNNGQQNNSLSQKIKQNYYLNFIRNFFQNTKEYAVFKMHVTPKGREKALKIKKDSDLYGERRFYATRSRFVPYKLDLYQEVSLKSVISGLNRSKVLNADGVELYNDYNINSTSRAVKLPQKIATIWTGMHSKVQLHKKLNNFSQEIITSFYVEPRSIAGKDYREFIRVIDYDEKPNKNDILTKNLLESQINKEETTLNDKLNLLDPTTLENFKLKNALLQNLNLENDVIQRRTEFLRYQWSPELFLEQVDLNNSVDKSLEENYIRPGVQNKKPIGVIFDNDSSMKGYTLLFDEAYVPLEYVLSTSLIMYNSHWQNPHLLRIPYFHGVTGLKD